MALSLWRRTRCSGRRAALAMLSLAAGIGLSAGCSWIPTWLGGTPSKAIPGGPAAGVHAQPGDAGGVARQRRTGARGLPAARRARERDLRRLGRWQHRSSRTGHRRSRVARRGEVEDFGRRRQRRLHRRGRHGARRGTHLRRGRQTAVAGAGPGGSAVAPAGRAWPRDRARQRLPRHGVRCRDRPPALDVSAGDDALDAARPERNGVLGRPGGGGLSRRTPRRAGERERRRALGRRRVRAAWGDRSRAPRRCDGPAARHRGRRVRSVLSGPPRVLRGGQRRAALGARPVRHDRPGRRRSAPVRRRREVAPARVLAHGRRERLAAAEAREARAVRAACAAPRGGHGRPPRLRALPVAGRRRLHRPRRTRQRHQLRRRARSAAARWCRRRTASSPSSTSNRRSRALPS